MFERFYKHSLGLLGLSFALLMPLSAAFGQATDLVCGGCVQGSDIANGTIGPNKLIPGSINATTIANGSIGPNKLIPGSINTTTIATDAIRSNKILDGAVKSADIGDGEITGIDIQDDSLAATELSNEAGADYSGSGVAFQIEATDRIVQTVAITAPSAGVVIVTASGFFESNGTATTARCSISTIPSVLGVALFAANLDASGDLVPFATVRGFDVSAGSGVYSLVCDITAAAGSANVRNPQIAGMFFPTSY